MNKCVVVLCAAVLLLLTGCAAGQQGKWKDTVYYNTWMNMAFDLSATDFVQDKDSLRAVRAESRDIGDGVTTDFYLCSNSGDVEIMLQYAPVIGDSDQPEKDYLAKVGKALTEDPANTLVDVQSMELGDDTYLVLPVMQGETLARAVLVRRLDDTLIVWTMDANADTALASAERFFYSIKSVD